MPSGTEKHATRIAERGGLNRILLCMFLLTIADTHFAGAQVSDVSDSLWAIVLPTATAIDIDMGRVRVNDSKDSVVSGFIKNTGPVAIRIEAITFDGIDAGMFDLQSGPPPFELAIGEAKDVEFRFTPSSVGVKTATITLRTQAGSSSHSIRGEAVLPGIEVLAVLVDFGSVAVGKMKDTVVAAIRNTGIGALDISGIRQLGPDRTQFSVLSGDGAFTLGPGEERSIELRFAPTKGGRTSGSVGWYHDGVGSPAMVHLFGNGKAPEGRATIAVDTIRARVGEIVDIPVYLREQTDLVSSGATGFYSEFRYNASLLAPIGDTPKGILSDGECTILLETLPAQPDSRGILTTLKFIAMLGNAEGTPLRLEHSFAMGGNIDVTEIPGYFLLTDLCSEGGVRLFHEYGRAGLHQNRPNPFNAATIIEYDVIERAPTRLYVMDMLGRIQAVLLDAIVEAGSYTISFDASSLASGTYVCVLQTPSQRFLKLMEVVK